MLILTVWAWWDADPEVTDTTQETTTQLPPRTAPAQPAPPAVREYVEFGTQPEQVEAEMGRDHDYTVTGLQRLTAALDEVVQQETINEQPLEERLGRIREQANRIAQDPQSLKHANMVRDAFMEASALIEAVRERRAPEQPDIEQHARAARNAAETLDTETPLLDQRDTVRQFFRASAEAIHQLSTVAPG